MAPAYFTGAVFTHWDFMKIRILKQYITAIPNRVEKGTTGMCCHEKQDYPRVAKGENDSNIILS